METSTGGTISPDFFEEMGGASTLIAIWNERRVHYALTELHVIPMHKARKSSIQLRNVMYVFSARTWTAHGLPRGTSLRRIDWNWNTMIH